MSQVKTNVLGQLGTPSGAGFIGYGAQTLDLILKNQLGAVVNSVAALKALDKTKYTEAYVTGYRTAGDKGGPGPVYLDAADTTSADDGGTVFVAADGGRWKPTTTAGITLKKFGCYGDGVTNDSVFAQNAVNYALATNGVVLDDTGSNFKLLTGLTVSGTFRSIKFKGTGTGDAQTASSGGSCFNVTGAVTPITATFSTFANENIIIDGFNFYNSTADQLNNLTAVKIIRGAANNRYVSGFVFRDVGILNFGAAFSFQGMNTAAVENNYFGSIVFDNVSVQATGIFLQLSNCVLNLVSMRSVNILDCKYGGIRCGPDGDVGAGIGKGSAINASLLRCHFEGVGGMFRTQATTVTGTSGTIRSDITLVDFTHESCGTTTGPVAGEPYVLGVNTSLHLHGKIDSGITYGEVSLPRMNATAKIDSSVPFRCWMDGGRNLSPRQINAPIYYRSIANSGTTTITVGIDQASTFAIKSYLILSGGQAGIIESLHQGADTTAPTRTPIAGAPTAGITLTWGAVVAGGAIQLRIDNASGFTVTAELQIENLSSATITAASEV